jgi:hypothetical protein
MTAFAMISAMAYHSKSIMLVSKFCHGAVRNSRLLQQHKLQHLAVKSLLSRNFIHWNWQDQVLAVLHDLRTAVDRLGQRMGRVESVLGIRAGKV